MKWSELQEFIWEDFSLLSWADIAEDKYTLLQKFWNGEVQLSPEAVSKLQELCRSFYEDYKNHVKPYTPNFHPDFWRSAKYFAQFLREAKSFLDESGIDLQVFVRDFLHKFFDLFSAFFS